MLAQLDRRTKNAFGKPAPRFWPAGFCTRRESRSPHQRSTAADTANAANAAVKNPFIIILHSF
jgi:hypothetical protein